MLQIGRERSARASINAAASVRLSAIGILVVVLLSLAAVDIASAADKRALDRVTYIGNASYHTRTERNYEVALALWAMKERFRADRSLNATQLVDEANKSRAQYRENVGLSNGEFSSEKLFPVHAARAYFEVIKSGDAPASYVGAVADEMLSWHYRNLDEAGRLPAQRAAQAKLFTDETLLSFADEEIWTDVYDFAQESPQFALAVDMIAAPSFFASVSDPREVILKNNPEYEAALKAQDVYDVIMSGDLATEEDIKDAEGRLTNSLTAQLDEVLETTKEEVKAANRARAAFGDWIAQEEARRKTAEEAQQTRHVQQLELEMQRSGAYIVGTLLSSIDPKLGRTFSVLANAGIRAQEIRFDYLANVKMGGEAADLAFNAATLNYVALALSVASAFAGGSDDGTGAILEALRQISQQIETLREEMHDRFDIVDAQLETILKTLDRNFDSIHADLDTIKLVTADTQRSTLTLLSLVMHMQESASLRLRDIAKMDFENTAASCYAYRSDTPTFSISDEKFVECLTQFKQWALAASRREIFDISADVSSSFADPAWAGLPDWAPLERLATELHNVPGVTTKEAGSGLGDATVFLSGVDAYLAMLHAWPEKAKRLVTPGSLDDFKVALEQDSRFQASLIESTFTSALRAYVDEAAFVRELLLADAVVLNRNQLSLFGPNQLSLFRPANKQMHSRVGTVVSDVKACTAHAAEAIERGRPGYGDRIEYDLGDAVLPNAWLKRLEAIDLVTGLFAGTSRENLTACYSLTLRPLMYVAYDHEDYGPTWYPNLRPVFTLQVKKRDEVILEVDKEYERHLGPDTVLKIVGPIWKSYYGELPPYYYRVYWDFITRIASNGALATGLLKVIADEWEENPRKFRWPSEVTADSLPRAFEDRLGAVRKLYAEGLRSGSIGDTKLARAINRATFLKKTIRRFLLSLPADITDDLGDFLYILGDAEDALPDRASFEGELTSATEALTADSPPPPAIFFGGEMPRWITAIVPEKSEGPAFHVLKQLGETLAERIVSLEQEPSEATEALLFRIELHKAILEAK